MSGAARLPALYAALRPRDGFSHPHQEHMKDTYSLCLDVPGQKPHVQIIVRVQTCVRIY